MLPKLENKTQTGTIVYIVLLIINCSTCVYNIYYCTLCTTQCIYSVQQNKAYARLNIARQQSSCSAAVWHGIEHVPCQQQNTYQYQRIFVCILFWKIMLNRSLIVILWPFCGLLKQIINHYRSKFVLRKFVLTGVCCKHFMYTCIHRSCTLYCVHMECMSTYFVIRLLFLFNIQNSDNVLLKYECQICLFP